ncbi:unnamed protein product, partial [Mesorhabditis spiculigera]
MSAASGDLTPCYNTEKGLYQLPSTYSTSPDPAPYPHVHRGTFSQHETFSTSNPPHIAPPIYTISQSRSSSCSYDDTYPHPPCVISVGGHHDTRPWMVKNKRRIQFAVLIVILFLIVVPLIGFLLHLIFKN